MIEVISSDQLLSSLLPVFNIREVDRWTPSRYNIVIHYIDIILLYNSLSKCFAQIPDSYGNILNKDMVLESNDISNEDLLTLAKNGFIVPEQTNELKTYYEINDLIRSLKSSETGIKRYNILTTTGCNIRCFYCFEEGIKPISMTVDTAEQVADYVIDTRDKKNLIQLRWFGGEPLVNNKVIDIISRKLLDNNVQFKSTMSSNGILFSDSIIKRSKEIWNLKKVRTSFDGLEYEHNKRKNAVSSLNPFKITISNIDKLINAGIFVDIRFTLDLDNSSDLLKLAKFLCDIYEGNPLVKMYTRCIFQETTSSAATKNLKKVQEVISKKEDLDKYLRSRNVFDYNRLLPIGYQPYYCAANDPNAVVISPNGELCCCETIDERSIFWGNIKGNIYDNEERGKWLSHSKPHEKCKSCKFLPSCTPFAKNKCKNDYFDCVGRAENCYKIFLIHLYQQINKDKLS